MFGGARDSETTLAAAARCSGLAAAHGRGGPHHRRAGHASAPRPLGASASACAGRLLKTVKFATGELRVYKNRALRLRRHRLQQAGHAARHVRSRSSARRPRRRRQAARFTRQAGPVTVHALNRCVRATGAISGRRALHRLDPLLTSPGRSGAQLGLAAGRCPR